MLDPPPRPGVTAPLSIWVVSDGRIGMENQALGLAEAVQRLTPATIAVKRIRWRKAFDKLPSALKAGWMLDPSSDPVLPGEGEVPPGSCGGFVRRSVSTPMRTISCAGSSGRDTFKGPCNVNVRASGRSGIITVKRPIALSRGTRVIEARGSCENASASTRIGLCSARWYSSVPAASRTSNQ